ncbi:MAG: 50S ribosomal protein L24 [Candidatus Atabeyarchaeum deiterrae]
MSDSKSPRKQRRAIYRAPLHRRRKALAAQLSPELREKYGVRNIPVRKDDEVLIKDGAFSGIQGKVLSVDLKKHTISVDGAAGEKTSGQSYTAPIRPNHVTIVKLKLDDWRNKILKRKGASLKEEKEVG